MGNSAEETTASGGDTSRWPYVILLAAVLGMLAPQVGVAPVANVTTTTDTATASKSDSTKVQESFASRLNGMLRETQGIAETTPIEGDKTEAVVPSVPVNETSPHDVTINYLIATVHDPIDSHLQMYLDSDLAVIQRAVQRHGFVLHRYWLPWQDWIYARLGSKAPAASAKRTYEDDPGILLFRKVKQNGGNLKVDLLVILVVGETPTAGVHVNAYRSALDHAYEGGDQLSMRVIGPSASGTCASLRLATTAWYQDHVVADKSSLAVQFISGSATSEDALRQLKVGKASGPGLTLDVRTTVLSDKVLAFRMLEYLNDVRHLNNRQIAILVEADTSYGQGAVEADTSYGQGARSAWDGVLMIPYPMEIGTVRDEYEKFAALKYGPEAQKGKPPRTNLEVSWKQPPEARDLVPVFSDATPAVTERRLALLLSSLARRDIRAVGLLGTDPKDLLFLGQQIRRFCSDVQLFTLESNVMYTHPDYIKYFKGTIVASTYPLFVNNQEWTRRTEERSATQFPSGTSEGMFNATLAHLSSIYEASGHVETVALAGAKTAGSAVPKMVPLIEYAEPFNPISYGSPPMWISIVGQNSLSPIKTVSARDSSADEMKQSSGAIPTPSNLLFSPKKLQGATQDADESSDKSETTNLESASVPMPDKPIALPPLTLTSVIISISVMVTVATFIYHALQYPRISDDQLGRQPSFWPWLMLVPTTSDSVKTRFIADRWWYSYAAVLLVGLAVIQFLTAFITLLTIGLPDWLYSSRIGIKLIRGFALGTAFLCLTAIALLIARARGFGRVDRANHRRRTQWLFYLIVLAMVIGFLVAATRWPISGNSQIGAAIRAERWGDVFNGVTPLVPVMTMAMIPILWAFCQLRRCYFLEIYSLNKPFPTTHKSGLSMRLDELEEKLRDAYWRPSEFRDWFLLLALIGAAVLLYLNWISTADTPWFDAFILVYAIINLSLIFGLHVRFMAVSGHLERLLRRIAQTSLASAFEKVPNRLRDKAAAQIFAAGPHPGDVDIAIRQLEKLVRQPADRNQLIVENCRKAREKYNDLDSLPRNQRAAVYKGMADVECLLSACSGDIACRIFQKDESQESEAVQEAPQGNKAAANDKSTDDDARIFVAIQVTTLLRQAFTQLQNMLTFLMLMLLMLLWAFSSYPFQPQRLITLCAIGLCLWMVVSTVYVFIKFNRNEILSYLAKTTPNRFTLDRSLFRQVAVFGAVPLLSMLAWQFPEVGNILFFWVDGLQQAFR